MEKISITIAGPSGVGKSGVAAMIVKALAAHGIWAKIFDDGGATLQHIGKGSASKVLDSIAEQKVEIEIFEVASVPVK